MVADMGNSGRIPAIIGDGHFRELALTGRDIDAPVPSASAWSTTCSTTRRPPSPPARAAATEIADNPPLVVHGIKQVLDRARSAAVDDSLRFVAAWNAAFLPSNDLSEAITAIFESASRISSATEPIRPSGPTSRTDGSSTRPQPEHRDLLLRAPRDRSWAIPNAAPATPGARSSPLSSVGTQSHCLPPCETPIVSAARTLYTHCGMEAAPKYDPAISRSAPSGADNSRVRRTMPLYARAHRG